MTDYTAAKSFCQSVGGELGAPDNSFDKDFLISSLPNEGDYFWIGISRDGSNWKDNDGKSVTFSGRIFSSYL